MPSATLSATLPVKPSVTTTSTLPLVTSVPSTKPRNSIGRSLARRAAAASRIVSWPLASSVPMLSRPTVGFAMPSTARAKTSPITANCTRLAASHSAFAPRSRNTVALRRVGISEAIAGRSIPGRVLSTNLESAIRAPVLPADTAAAARPSFTASIARPMLLLRPWRRTCEGLASRADLVRRVLDRGLRAELGPRLQEPTQLVLIAEQQEAQAGEPFPRHVGACDHHLRRVVAAHGVEGDGQRHGVTTAHSAALSATRAITSRPL